MPWKRSIGLSRSPRLFGGTRKPHWRSMFKCTGVSWRGAGRFLNGARLTHKGLLWCLKAQLRCVWIRRLWPGWFATALREKATPQLRDSGATLTPPALQWFPQACLRKKGTAGTAGLLWGALTPHWQSLDILDRLVVFAKGVPTMWALTLTKINP